MCLKFHFTSNSTVWVQSHNVNPWHAARVTVVVPCVCVSGVLWCVCVCVCVCGVLWCVWCAVVCVCVCLSVRSFLPPCASRLQNIGAYVFTMTRKTFIIVIFTKMLRSETMASFACLR